MFKVRGPGLSLQSTLSAVTAMVALSGIVNGQPPEETSASSQRIVHRFDFDERSAGNLEDVPKFWTPLRLAGFPRFAEGAFDFEMGRSSPPTWLQLVKRLV